MFFNIGQSIKSSFFLPEILKDNCELAERKDDPKNYPAYMAVQHIRDQLIPVAKR